MQKVRPQVVKSCRVDQAHPVSSKPARKDIVFTPKERKHNSVIKNVVKMILCFGLVILFIWLLFLTTKGSANVSFSSDLTEESDLSLLRSQCINITSGSLAVHVSQHHFLQTKVTGEAIYLSSDSLSDWIKRYLTDLGTTDYKEGYLVIANGEPQCEINLTFADDKDSTSIVRYETSSFSDTKIDELDSNALSSSAKMLKLYPAITQGEAFSSSVCVERQITINIPTEVNSNLFIDYRNKNGESNQIKINPEVLPGYLTVKEGDDSSFRIVDSMLHMSSEEDEEIQFDISGQFVLDLWAMEISKIRGYFSGALSFQYTNPPSNYSLENQFVEVSSAKSELNMVLRKGIRVNDEEEWNGTERIYFDGKATQMYTSGISLFPNIQMWLRENVYIAPLSLLSAVIAVYNLPFKGKKKE